MGGFYGRFNNITASADPQGNTAINFADDEIAFITSGSNRMTIGNQATQINNTLMINETNGVSNLIELHKADSEVSELAFFKDGTEYASIYMNSYENLVVSVQQENSTRQFSVRAGNEEAFNINGGSKSIRLWQDNSPQKYINLNGRVRIYNELILGTQNGDPTPDNSNLFNGSTTFFLDEGNHKLHIKVKYSDGLVKSGSIDLN
jgi:hypothetical protein